MRVGPHPSRRTDVRRATFSRKREKGKVTTQAQPFSRLRYRMHTTFGVNLRLSDSSLEFLWADV